MAITQFDTPAQQQAMPYQAPEPLAAYQGALAALQGRYDKAYLGAQQKQQSLAAVTVRGQDEGAKKAYTDLFAGHLERILNNHNGNYAEAANEIDNLTNWITGDGHLAGMNSAYNNAVKVRDKIQEDPTQLAFNLDALYKPYFKPSGDVNTNLSSQLEKREDWFGAQDKIFSKLQPRELADIKTFAKDPAFYDQVHTSDLTGKRIAEAGNRNLNNYIKNTKEGNQHYRATTQDVLRELSGGQIQFLNQASPEQLNAASAIAKKKVLNDILDTGSLYTQHEETRSLLHNPEFRPRAEKAGAKATEYSQMVMSDTIPLTTENNPNLNLLSGDDFDELRQGSVPADRRQNQADVVNLLNGIGQAALGPLNLIPGVRESFAKDRKENQASFAGASQYKIDTDQRKLSFGKALAGEYGSEIWGADRAKAINAKLQKDGGLFNSAMTDSERKKFADWSQKFGMERIPVNVQKSLEVRTLSPDAVKLAGREPGQTSFNQAVFGNSTNKLIDVPNTMPLYTRQGQMVTAGDVKLAAGIIDAQGKPKPNVPDVSANVSGVVSPNSGSAMAASWGANSNRFMELNLGGEKYYTFAPNQQIIHNNQKGDNVYAYGELQGHNKMMFDADMRYRRAGRATVPEHNIPGVRGLTASYQVDSQGVSAEHDARTAKVAVKFTAPNGQKIDAGTHIIDNFFDQIDKGKPDMGLPRVALDNLSPEFLQNLPASTTVGDVVSYALLQQIAGQQAAKSKK
jgi:hypothetical protein